MRELHQIQLNILKKLLFAAECRYADLKPKKMENSQFKFHIDKLIDQGWVEKLEKGRYILTSKGKELANRMNPETAAMKKQPKLTTQICCIRTDSGTCEHLIYTRKKHPFYGCQGYPSEKAWFGENISETAKRGLKEETNLEGDGGLVAIKSYKVYSKNGGQLLDDVTVFIFKFENPTGELKNGREGEFEWVREDELKKVITNPLEETWRVYNAVRNYDGNLTYEEVDHYTDKF